MTYLILMQFSSPLVHGTLQQRYKRFLADVQLADGRIVTAHCPNSGAMLGVQPAGAPVWLSYKDDGKRKHPYTWEMVEVDGVLVGINTQHPNRIVEEALLVKRIEPLAAYHHIKREAVMGASRFDFLLQGEGLPPCYLEVKNVHLKRGAPVEFPDSMTSRGTKHLNELAQLAQQGYRAVMLYCVQRQDGEAFRLADDIDPAYAAAFAAARAAGVEALCYTARVTPTSITLDAPLPFAV